MSNGDDDGNESPSEVSSMDEDERVVDYVTMDLFSKFDDMFVCMFIVDKQKEWEDRFLFKDFTSRNRVTLTQTIPTFVDKEFGADLLLQSLPVLSASLRTVYLLREDDHRRGCGGKPRRSRVTRSDVLECLRMVTRDYIVHPQDGVEVVRRIIEKKVDEGIGSLE